MKKFFSSSELAKELSATTEEVNDQLERLGFQTHETFGKKRVYAATEAGFQRGAMNMVGRFGKYVSWPRDIMKDLESLKKPDASAIALKDLIEGVRQLHLRMGALEAEIHSVLEAYRAA